MSIKPEELKPCPFCGGPADYGRGGRYAYNYYVICQKCGAQCLGSAFQNDAFNARSWNTRTIPDTHRVVSVELLELAESLFRAEAVRIVRGVDWELPMEKATEIRAIIEGKPCSQS